MLQVLHVNNNQLKRIPNGIGNLKNLQSLDLEGNQLEFLPDGIEHLSQVIDNFELLYISF